METKLSIVVPVYNVEKYIRPCMESIFQQGLDEDCYEVIIVNDGTKDRSMEMIADIISQHQNITVINQENQGLSVARNNGIATAKGAYILMPDSDDLLIENSLKPLLEKALETEVDLLVADYLSMNDQEIEEKHLHIPQQSEPAFVEKTGQQLFLEEHDPYHCYVWRTLFKRDYLIHSNVRFVPGIRYQDVPFTHECYLKADKCLRTSWLLNIYRRGHESATSTFDLKRAKDFSIAIGKTWELTKLDNLVPAELHKLHDDVFISFSMMIRLTCHYMNKKSERVKAIHLLKQEAPDLRFCHGKKQEIISFLYQKTPHLFMHVSYLYVKMIEDRLLPYYYHHFKKSSS